MLNIADYRFPDVGSRFDRAYDRANTIRTDAARARAGNALKGGDYAGASAELLSEGDLNAGVRIQQLGAEQEAGQAKAKADREAEAMKYTADFATRLATFHARSKDIGRTLQAFDMGSKKLLQLGETPEEIAEVRASLERDPDGTLSALGAGAKKYQLANGGDGRMGVFDPDAGTINEIWKANPKPIEMDPTKDYYLPETEGGPPAEAAPAPAATSATPQADAVWKSIHAQESGGDATPGDAVGPDTRYGNALGSTQMLPATAEAMARKLGIAWNPALMRENSPKALAYQDKLGRAYFDEGVEKAGGDPAGGAAYYFGGPDPKLHGPKTRAYVQQVMARAGAGSQPYEIASNGPTPPPPGYRVLQRGRPKAEKTARPATAEEKAAFGVAPDVPAQIKPDGSFDVISGTGATLKKVPAAVQSGYVDNRKSISQIDAAIAAIRSNPHALGYKNKLGDDIMQRVDANGVPVRAAVANIGSLLIHDRSGAAVTAAEQPRLMPFIPQVSDTADAAIKKLELLKEQYGASNSEIETVFGEDAGYGAMGGVGKKPGAAAPAAKLKSDPQAVAAAKVAIRRGADPKAVAQRLREHGIDPAGL